MGSAAINLDVFHRPLIPGLCGIVSRRQVRIRDEQNRSNVLQYMIGAIVVLSSMTPAMVTAETALASITIVSSYQ